MSLHDWLADGWLIPHETSPKEIADLLTAAERDLLNCRVAELSADWRLNIAHNSTLLSATVALAACGYRASREARHYRIIQSLGHTIGADTALVRKLDRFRKKRNLGAYERAGTVSDHEASEAARLAQHVRQAVEDWLRVHYPELLAG